MKVAVMCECIVMQKALEKFLDEFLVDYESADFIVSDVRNNLSKHTFLISNDSPYMSLPFSKKELVVALEEYGFMLKYKKEDERYENIEDKISALCENFKKNLLDTIKEHYE